MIDAFSAVSIDERKVIEYMRNYFVCHLQHLVGNMLLVKVLET